MASDANDQTPPERTRINVHDEHDLRYRKFGVSIKVLLAAVSDVGPDPDKVAEKLGKSH